MSIGKLIFVESSENEKVRKYVILTDLECISSYSLTTGHFRQPIEGVNTLVYSVAGRQ